MLYHALIFIQYIFRSRFELILPTKSQKYIQQLKSAYFSSMLDNIILFPKIEHIFYAIENCNLLF